MNFSELNLHPTLFAAIEKSQFSQCTPIQEKSIPLIFQGRDIAGLAQTGTGKTAAFLVPLMERILRAKSSFEHLSEAEKVLHAERAFKDWRGVNFILVLVPTRELAEQVLENVQKLSEISGLRGVSIYGGTGYEKQREMLKQGVEFVVATPGRLIDLYKEHLVDLKQVRAVVFDEADRMFDMGFKDDMKYILQRIPKERQYLVFSATLNFDVLNTAYQFGAEPVEINISRDQTKAENVKDAIFHVGNEDKPQQLLSLLKKYNPKQAIIFTNFKNSVDKISHFLVENGIPAMGISSLLSQGQRNRVIESFKADNEKNILVATDVAARGLDIKGVDLVINFELPQDSESYVHRIGRTGRAGHEGTALSLVSDRDVDSLMRIEDYLKTKIVVGFVEDKDLIKDFVPLRDQAVNFQRREKREPKGRPTGRRGETQSRRNGPRFAGSDQQDGNKQHESRDQRQRAEHPRERVRDRDQESGSGRDRDRDRNIERSHDKKFDRDRSGGRHNKIHGKGHSASKEGAHSPDSFAGKKSHRKNHKSSSSFRKGSYGKKQSLGEKIKNFFGKIFG